MGTHLTFDLDRVRPMRVENGWSHLSSYIGILESGGRVMSATALCGAYLIPSSIEPPAPGTICERCIDIARAQGCITEVIVEDYPIE